MQLVLDTPSVVKRWCAYHNKSKIIHVCARTKKKIIRRTRWWEGCWCGESFLPNKIGSRLLFFLLFRILNHNEIVAAILGLMKFLYRNFLFPWFCIPIIFFSQKEAKSRKELPFPFFIIWLINITYLFFDFCLFQQRVISYAEFLRDDKVRWRRPPNVFDRPCQLLAVLTPNVGGRAPTSVVVWDELILLYQHFFGRQKILRFEGPC